MTVNKRHHTFHSRFMSEGFVFSTFFLGEHLFPLKITVFRTQSNGKKPTTGLLDMDEPHIMLSERSEEIAYTLCDSIYLKFKSISESPYSKIYMLRTWD